MRESPEKKTKKSKQLENIGDSSAIISVVNETQTRLRGARAGGLLSNHIYLYGSRINPFPTLAEIEEDESYFERINNDADGDILSIINEEELIRWSKKR